MEFSQPKGIYQQIADQVREQIVTGDWKSGERLPSVRELAVTMGVNPNTVARSYQILLDNMIIENKRGVGFFVTAKAREKIMKEIKLKFIEVELPQIFETMKKLSISRNELVTFYDAHINGGIINEEK